jgi:hypothetical protein
MGFADLVCSGQLSPYLTPEHFKASSSSRSASVAAQVQPADRAVI